MSIPAPVFGAGYFYVFYTKISYDSLGRPTVYRDKTMRFDYAVRLDKIGGVEYTYDYKGRRKTKISGNSLTQYYYIGDKLDRIVINSVNYKVIYGLSGIVGFGNYDLMVFFEAFSLRRYDD